MTDPADWLTLALTPGLGPVGCKILLEHFVTPEAIFTASRQALGAVKGLSKSVIGAIGHDAPRKAATLELAKIKQEGITLLGLDDPAYPPLLRTIHDPPMALYVKGDPEILSQPTVGLVGSRAASSYGLEMATLLGRQLARAGYTTVSGLALGIDTAVHKGSLQDGGTSIAVLGCGVDVVYPRQNEALFLAIARTGAVVSEYPLGTKPEGFRFPARNRIISGLSLGVVVVEATRRSGSLITANLALEQGREVFAIPGRMDSIKSEGAHRLLQEGAKLIMNSADILRELPPSDGLCRIKKPATDASVIRQEEVVSPGEQQILACLEVYPQGIDEIIANSGFRVQQVNEFLLLLELKGLCESLPGHLYRKTCSVDQQ
ncbi:MAG: DNA-processing protein DprA [Proteobacteria bacterium]|nr:DNA-processing protein DprA [Pseudomonadota bacterium]MBU1687538.1 DNA-processing protein DprA [Pseudomonadota bacterium]